MKRIDELTIEQGMCLGKVREVAELCGWDSELYDDKLFLMNYSPAGEDLTFDVSLDKPIQDICEFCLGFCVDEYVDLLRGRSDVSSSVSEIVKDAEETNNMLEELATAVSTITD